MDYECYKATTKYIRNHQLSLLHRYYTDWIKQKDKQIDDSVLKNIIREVLLTYISDSTCNLSIRGYATFGLDNQVLHDIHLSIIAILEQLFYAK